SSRQVHTRVRTRVRCAHAPLAGRSGRRSPHKWGDKEEHTPPSPAEMADGPPTSGGTKKNTRPPRRPKWPTVPPPVGGQKIWIISRIRCLGPGGGRRPS